MHSQPEELAGRDPADNPGAEQSFYEANTTDPMGIISEEDSIKLKQMSKDYYLRKFTYLMKTEQIEKIEEIALAQEFLKQNPEFCSSGELVYLALVHNQRDLLAKLFESGYKSPDSLITRAINDRNKQAVEYLIARHLYSRSGIEVILWMLIKTEHIETAELLLSQENIARDLFLGYNLLALDLQDSFLSSPDIASRVLKSALDTNQDDIACELLITIPNILDPESVTKAVENNCVETIKVIWTGNLIPSSQVSEKRASKSPIWNKLDLEISERSERKKLNRILRIPSILSNLLKFDRVADASKVLDWPEACNEVGILRILTHYNQPDLIMKHLEKTQIDVSGPEFLEAYEKGFYKACVRMLHFKEPKGTLTKKKIQESLISLLESGETCLDAVQILGFINQRDWTTDLTVDLCETLDTFINDSEEIVSCSSPILFCVLTAEFLNSISLNSAQNKHRCLECADSFVQLAFHIEKNIKETETLKFLLLEKDCKDRSALFIMAENDMLSLLEGVSIGAIVSNLWKGPDAENIWDASRLWTSFTGEEFLQPVDVQAPYRFSFSIWAETCSIRSITGSISVVFLLIVYNCLIIQGLKYGNFANLDSNPSTDSLFTLAKILIVGLMSDLVMQYFFCAKTKRTFNLDAMRLLDLAIFFQMLLIMAGLQNNMGDGKKYPGADPVLFVGLIHSLENLFIWIRMLLLLITTKRLGPFLFMIWVIMQQMIAFYFLFACFSIWFGAVFTALYSDTMDEFVSFWVSIRTLYGSSLGGFDFTKFAGNDKQVLGCLLLGLYLIITNIILLNLFIALFTAIYQDIQKKVESTYRSSVILNSEKWRWDNKFGSLILYSTPFSAFGFFFGPILSYMKDPTNLNLKVSKITYSLVYGFMQMVLLLVFDLILVPFVYFVGFVKYPEMISDASVSYEDIEQSYVKSYSWKKLVLWAFCGIFICLYHVLQDLRTFWKIVFTDYPQSVNLHPFVNEENLKIMKETLKCIQQNYVMPEELANLWVFVKNLMSGRPENNEEISNAQDFCVFFSVSTKDRRINVRLMERVLKGIEEQESEKLSNIRLPFISKSIAGYKNLLGGVEIEGKVLPKKIGNPGGPVDTHNMANTYKLMQQMEKQINYFYEVMKKISP